MITWRLVAMYGWRSVPGARAGVSRRRWWQIMAFASTGHPRVVAAAVHFSAQALAGSASFGAAVSGRGRQSVAGSGRRNDWSGALLAVVAALQALRPDSGAALFFPPTRLLDVVGTRGMASPMAVAADRPVFAAVAKWIVDSVPEDIGHGYIDYRRRRILPGHVFALSLALTLALLCLVGAVALSPARCAPDDWLPAIVSRLLCARSAARVPALARLLLVLMAAGGFWRACRSFSIATGCPPCWCSVSGSR